MVNSNRFCAVPILLPPTSSWWGGSVPCPTPLLLCREPQLSLKGSEADFPAGLKSNSKLKLSYSPWRAAVPQVSAPALSLCAAAQPRDKWILLVQL